jgi:leader peptidase (prepilin peptidase) / N-methyltransferase
VKKPTPVSHASIAFVVPGEWWREMTRALRRTSGRTKQFFASALACRTPERQHALVAWCLIAGTASLIGSVGADPDWPETTLAGLYLAGVLAAVCAIDARYGIIPNSFVAALAAGGMLQTALPGQPDLLQRGLQAMLFFLAALLFRAGYRWLRGHDGLGLGDVKFATAGILWIGIEGFPEFLLLAVLSALASLLILKAEGHDLDGQQAISFGPHLAVGLWFTWIAGTPQFGWY